MPRRATFRPARTGILAPLGELESAVMRHIWAGADDGWSAADLLETMQGEHPMALTTLLTTLDRLHEKGIVRRAKEGKAYRFHPAVTEKQLNQRIVDGVMDGLIARFPDAVATYFAQAGQGGSSKVDPSLGDTSLRDLAARLDQMKRRPN